MPRWGNYLGAAQDPVNPKDVWVVCGSVDNTAALGPCATIVNAYWNTQSGRGEGVRACAHGPDPVAGARSRWTDRDGQWDRGFDPTTTATFAGEARSRSASPHRG